MSPASACVDRHALEPREREHLADLRLRGNLALPERPVQHRDLGAGPERPAADAADAQPPDVARIVERRDLELQRRGRVPARLGHVRENRVEQRLHVAALGGLPGLRDRDVQRRPSAQRGRVDDREVELRVGRAQPVEQVERLVDHPFGARPRAVDLVDDDDRLQAELERLQRDEPRLRHRPLDRVDEQQHAVDHAEHALDLAAEVGVAGRVDDVDARVAQPDRAVLREDRDAPLALDVVAVHHALADLLVTRERPRLNEQLVDQRRLAVVDVRDDGDVAEGLGHGRADRVEEGKKPSIITGSGASAEPFSGSGAAGWRARLECCIIVKLLFPAAFFPLLTTQPGPELAGREWAALQEMS